MKEHKDNSADSKKEKNNTKPKTSSNKEDVSKYTKKIQELELNIYVVKQKFKMHKIAIPRSVHS